MTAATKLIASCTARMAPSSRAPAPSPPTGCSLGNVTKRASSCMITGQDSMIRSHQTSLARIVLCRSRGGRGIGIGSLMSGAIRCGTRIRVGIVPVVAMTQARSC